MLFNSQFFILIFLPLALIGWNILNRLKLYNIALFFLAGMSFWFYAYFNPYYLIILVGSIAGNYFISFLMEKIPKGRKALFIIGLILNLGLLGYYKYFDFFVENINAVFSTDFALKNIVLPLGISFFTLQQVSYITDRFWESAPHYKIYDYLAYVTFFPQLIAGPIVLHNEIIPQFQDPEKRVFNKELFRDGCILFILGLTKKVILADTFALIVNSGFDWMYHLDTLSAWIVALGYTFELYFDFSGYCDMAVGLGKMFGFELPINFNSPYKSHSIPEYWTRWHATLTRFFTNYIYMPMTMKGMRLKKKKLFSILTPLVVYLISGFWHGASWTFIIWGLCQALATIWSQRKFWKIKRGKLRFITWFGTFFVTVITQAIFRSERWDMMVQILKRMFTLKYDHFMIELAKYALDNDKVVKGLMHFVTPYVSYMGNYWIYFGIMIVMFVIGAIILAGKNAHEMLASQKEKGYTAGFAVLLGILFAWCMISMSEVSTFLYFNF